MKSVLPMFLVQLQAPCRHPMPSACNVLFRERLPLRQGALIGFLLASQILSQAAVTDAVVSKNSPQLNQGHVKGSVRVMSGDPLNLNPGLTIDGVLIVPGTPDVRVNGGGSSPAITNGNGSVQPSGYRIAINNNITLGGGIRQRVDPESLPSAIAPAAGCGTRNVKINQPGDSPGNFATIRTLTISAQGGAVTLPPGRYRRITLNGSSTLNLQAGSSTSPALYEIQQLDVNGGSHVTVPGPVALRLNNSLNLNGYIGNPAHPEWLVMSLSGGSFTLASRSAFHGRALVPAGSLTVNSCSLVHGLAFTDRLTLNGGGVIECEGSGGTPNLPPVATAGETSTSISTPVGFPLVASDPENAPLVYQITSPPANGTVTLAGAIATYTPNGNFIGNDAFSFKASDGMLDSAPATFVIHVFQPNRAPVAVSGDFVINQGEANAPVVLTATDPDDDAISYQIVRSPALGTLSGSPPTLRYSHTGPRSTAVVEDTFTYTATDSKAAVSATANVRLHLQPVNRPPTATELAASGNEDSIITISLGGADPDGDALAYEIVADPANPTAAVGPLHGTLTGVGPQLSYQPAANFNGTDHFHFRVKDAAFSSAVAEVTITVMPVNDPPVVVAKSLTGQEDGTISIALEASDVDGDALLFEITTQPEHGTLTPNPAGSFLYTPSENFNGSDSFIYLASDADISSAPATASISITSQDDAPLAYAASHLLAEDGLIALTLSGLDVDGDAMVFEIVSQPQHGLITGNLPNLTYTPAENFNGPDSLSFKIIAAGAESSAATINFVTAPLNDTPVAVAASLAMDEDSTLSVSLAAADIEHDLLTYEVTAQPQHGNLSGIAPDFTYTPAANYYGPDSLSFVAKDATTTSIPAVISLLVRPLNDLPLAQNLSAITAEDTAVPIHLSATDADDAELAYSVTKPPATGTLTGTAPHFVYTPAPNFNGSDHFTYTASDATATSVPATVTINVTPENDVPTAAAASFTLNEDATISINLSGLDPDGDAVTYQITGQTSHGTLAGSPPALSYTPAGNFNGTDSFTFTVSDSSRVSQPAEILFVVRPVDDVPVATALTAIVAEDTSTTIELLGSDPDADAITYSVIAQPQHGTLTGTAPALTYSAAADFNGSDSFTFIVDDGTTHSSPATAAITVTPVDDRPVAAAATYTLRQRESKSFTLVGTSVDGDALGYVLRSQPARGVITGALPNLIYTPVPSFTGTETIEFVATSIRSGLVSAPATITFHVTRDNLAPLAPDFDVTIDGFPVAMVLPGSDPENLHLVYTVGTQAAALVTTTGTAPALTLARRFTTASQTSFTYTVRDDLGLTATGTVRVKILLPNRNPSVSSPSSLTMAEDATMAFRVGATDPDNDPLTYFIDRPVGSPCLFEGSGPEYLVRCTPNFTGTATFTARVTDGRGGFATRVINLTVSTTNDAPVATLGSNTTLEDTPLELAISAIDPEGSPVTYKLVSPPLEGSLAGTLPNLRYTPR